MQKSIYLEIEKNAVVTRYIGMVYLYTIKKNFRCHTTNRNQVLTIRHRRNIVLSEFVLLFSSCNIITTSGVWYRAMNIEFAYERMNDDAQKNPDERVSELLLIFLLPFLRSRGI